MKTLERLLTLPPLKTLAEVEKEHILTTLAELEGNKTHTAKSLGIGIRTLQRKLHIYFITQETGGVK